MGLVSSLWALTFKPFVGGGMVPINLKALLASRPVRMHFLISSRFLQARVGGGGRGVVGNLFG